ncbi:hypothetical protein EMCG_05316 [[Emmonsia] crescens]|uniref:BTB domain-containing protein n=1 Tax=[Emmonsia] crescens TaxID=73230 RepID=A0A0G2IXN8_9EURO|nr:hypothetical protein EMCG_05316 [Emmonsia crescens UAMH 3008]
MSAPLSPSSNGEREEATPSDNSQIVQIAVKGDIWFVVNKGPEKTKFRLQVSSDTLSEASEYFNRQFNSTWKESIGRNEANSGPGRTPFSISLYDDDVDALILLFNVLHHKIPAIPREPTTADLLQLAVVADKYRCESAVFPWTRVWLQGYLAKLELPGTVFEGDYELLYFTYILDLPQAFDKVSRYILFRYPADGLVGFSEHFLIRRNILAEFKTRNAEMFIQINECVQNAIDKIQRRPCTGKAQLILRIHRALRRCGLWPLSTASKQFGVTETCTRISNIRLSKPPSSTGSSSDLYPRFSHHRAYCYDSKVGHYEFKTSLMLELDRLTEGMRGVCLDCVKTNGESEKERKCRVPH